MSTDKRLQAGKHLTLVENSHLAYITNIPGHIVPAVACWRELMQEARLVVRDWEEPGNIADGINAIDSFVDGVLQHSVSIGGRGRDDLVKTLIAQEEAKIHRDAMVYGSNPTQRVEETGRGLRP